MNKQRYLMKTWSLRAGFGCLQQKLEVKVGKEEKSRVSIPVSMRPD